MGEKVVFFGRLEKGCWLNIGRIRFWLFLVRGEEHPLTERRRFRHPLFLLERSPAV